MLASSLLRILLSKAMKENIKGQQKNPTLSVGWIECLVSMHSNILAVLTLHYCVTKNQGACQLKQSSHGFTAFFFLNGKYLKFRFTFGRLVKLRLKQNLTTFENWKDNLIHFLNSVQTHPFIRVSMLYFVEMSLRKTHP